jgi:hypothetical protein
MLSLRLTGLPALTFLLAACAGGARRPPLAPEPAAECVVAGEVGGDSSAPSTAAATIAVTTLLDTAHAPWPRNAGERLLFAQIYEPLVRLDCTGAVVPALARSWKSATAESASADGTPASGVARLTFILRHDARFTNGDGVRAADVIAGWRASADAHAREPVAPLVSAIATGARATDDSTLVVELPDSLADVRAFASPQLAVSRPAGSHSRWPYGTTSYYVDSALEHYGPGPPESLPVIAIIGLHRRTDVTRRGAPAPGDTIPLLFDVQPEVDSRDILDWGADLLITSSPTAIKYARTQGSHTEIALPWARRYVLVLPARDDDGAGAGAGCAGDDLRPLRDALAVAVHVEARGAGDPCWWAARDSTGAARSLPRLSSRRILYPIQDTTARELAERVVALAAPGRNEPAAVALHRAAPELFEQSGWSASGADSVRFTESLSRARDGGYILALPSDPAWPAAARASLLAAAPWLAPRARTRSILPLVDTRETLLIRLVRGIPPMSIQHDGTVIFDPQASALLRNASSRSTP